jgi:hypothetical protein
VTVVTNRGAFQENPTYISYLDSRAKSFIKQTDTLLLACLDTSLGEIRLRKQIEAFTQDAIKQYRKHIDSTLDSLTMKELFESVPYQKHPLNTAIDFGSGGFRARHGEAEREFRDSKELVDSMQKQLKSRKSKGRR